MALARTAPVAPATALPHGGRGRGMGLADILGREKGKRRMALRRRGLGCGRLRRRKYSFSRRILYSSS